MGKEDGNDMAKKRDLWEKSQVTPKFFICEVTHGI
jgi:hypothetical protein